MSIPEERKQPITRNWDAIRILILAKWDRLHDADLWDVNPTIQDLTLLIKKKYADLPEASIIQDLENLIYQYKR